MLLVVVAAVSVLVSATRDCEQLATFYPGYQDCNARMKWLKDNYNQPDYIGKYPSIDGSYCSIQKFLSLETTRDGKPLYACPDPDADPVADTAVDLGNGVFSMIVYRNLKFSPDNPWSRRLLNANGANLHGAFQYLHAEVVPETQRMQADRDAKTRRFGINAIVAFNVTYKNPKPIRDQYGPGNKYLGPFVAYDAGQCTAGPNCPSWNSGYFVGVQAGDTTRTKYMGAKWLSFPQCGFCEWPTGEPNCTYTYSVIGKYDIDQMVMGKTLATESSALNKGLRMSDGTFITLEPRTYENLMNQGKFEWSRPNEKTVCPLVPTTSGLEFWKDPCDEFKCKVRMQRAIFAGVLNTSIAGPGEGPAPGTCTPPSLAPSSSPTAAPTPQPTTPAVIPTAASPTGAGTPSAPPSATSPTQAGSPTAGTPTTPTVKAPTETQAISNGEVDSGSGAEVWVPIVIVIIVLAAAAVGYFVWRKKFHKSHAYLLTEMDYHNTEAQTAEYRPPEHQPQAHNQVLR